MEPDLIIQEFERYEAALGAILDRFSADKHINHNDLPKLSQIAHEVKDLYGELGYKSEAIRFFNTHIFGSQNFYGSPSWNSVQEMRTMIRSSLTKFRRNPEGIIVKPMPEVPKASSQGNQNFGNVHVTGPAIFGGTNNSQQVSISIGELAQKVAESGDSEAKSALVKMLENPTIRAMLGAGVSVILGLLGISS